MQQQETFARGRILFCRNTNPSCAFMRKMYTILDMMTIGDKTIRRAHGEQTPWNGLARALQTKTIRLGLLRKASFTFTPPDRVGKGGTRKEQKTSFVRDQPPTDCPSRHLQNTLARHGQLRSRILLKRGYTSQPCSSSNGCVGLPAAQLGNRSPSIQPTFTPSMIAQWSRRNASLNINTELSVR